MKSELGFDLPNSPGEFVKGWCKCGQECKCVMKTYSNGTKHAHGVCPACGISGAKNQRLALNLEDLKYRLGNIRMAVLEMPRGLNQDEAICMIERLADDLSRETAR